MKIAREIVEGSTNTTSEEVVELTESFRDLYSSKPNVVSGPSEGVFCVGDLHGDLRAVKAIHEIFRRYDNHSILFLGDYGDRGPYQAETVNFVLALGLLYPNRTTLLRGNHECENIAARYGFLHDVREKYSDIVFQAYMRAFEALPLASLSNDGVFACHGGVPKGVVNLDDLQRPNRFTPNPEDSVVMQLLWNDPRDAEFEFGPNTRGEGILTYGKRAFDSFSEDLGIKLMFRAHEVFPDGFQEFFDRKLVSIFSTEYYGRVNPKIVRLGRNLQYEVIPI